MTFSRIGSAALVALLMAAGPALAHAELETAMPAPGTSGTSPAELRLDFSEGLALAFTSVTLTGADGVIIETGALALDPADATILVVPLPVPLPAGAVSVDWKAVADDGHKSQGSYSFTIAP
ncbi:MAG: copper homeostasis periplasmic binding protein CopC [Devosia sp.]